jgi:Uma2 family endonuclease
MLNTDVKEADIKEADVKETTKSVLTLPDHTQLPDSDGTFVKNFQEHPQSILLTESIRPILEQLHPDNQYCIGQDSGIYWRLIDPPEKGAESPDWYYVPNVPPSLDGKPRRSYVLWKEYVAPLIAIEFVSGNGKEERDKTPPSQSEGGKVGKFWVYEQAIRIPYYAIYEVEKPGVEVYYLQGNAYHLIPANARGHYEIPPLGVELGLWQGIYQNLELPWLRWWDAEGNLLFSGEERADQEHQRADQEHQRADQEHQRADQERQKRLTITDRLRSLSPDQLAALGIAPELLD